MLFLFDAAATRDVYTLSLHDALPICGESACGEPCFDQCADGVVVGPEGGGRGDRRGDSLRLVGGYCAGQRRVSRRHLDRKSTRLNSSHVSISYAVFCLKKKKT